MDKILSIRLHPAIAYVGIGLTVIILFFVFLIAWKRNPKKTAYFMVSSLAGYILGYIFFITWAARLIVQLILFPMLPDGFDDWKPFLQDIATDIPFVGFIWWIAFSIIWGILSIILYYALFKHIFHITKEVKIKNKKLKNATAEAILEHEERNIVAASKQISFESRFILSFLCMVAYFPAVYTGVGTVNAIVANSKVDRSNFLSSFFTSIGSSHIGDFDLFYTHPSDIRDTLDIAHDISNIFEGGSFDISKNLGTDRIGENFNQISKSIGDIVSSIDYEKIMDDLSATSSLDINNLISIFNDELESVSITDISELTSFETQMKSLDSTFQSSVTELTKPFSDSINDFLINAGDKNIFEKVRAVITVFLDNCFNEQHYSNMSEVLEQKVGGPNNQVNLTRLLTQILMPNWINRVAIKALKFIKESEKNLVNFDFDSVLNWSEFSKLTFPDPSNIDGFITELSTLCATKLNEFETTLNAKIASFTTLEGGAGLEIQDVFNGECTTKINAYFGEFFQDSNTGVNAIIKNGSEDFLQAINDKLTTATTSTVSVVDFITNFTNDGFKYGGKTYLLNTNNPITQDYKNRHVFVDGNLINGLVDFVAKEIFKIRPSDEAAWKKCTAFLKGVFSTFISTEDRSWIFK